MSKTAVALTILLVVACSMNSHAAIRESDPTLSRNSTFDDRLSLAGERPSDRHETPFGN